MADFEKKTGLIELEIDNSASQKAVSELTDKIVDQKSVIKANNDQISALNKANKELEKQVKKGSIEFEEANEEIKENTKRVKDLKKENTFLGDEIKDLNRERASAVKATKLQSNSLEALKQKVKDQTIALGKLGTETEEEIKIFNELSEELEDNVEKLKELQPAVNTLKVSLDDAGDSAGGLSGGISQTTEGLSGMPGPIGGVVSGLQGMVKGFGQATVAALRFLATPIGAIIGVIALAFLLVKNALERNADLMHKLTKALAPLQSAFEMLLGALQPVADFLIDGIVAGLQAAAKAVEWFIGILGDGLEKLGFEEAAENVRNFKEQVEEAGKRAQDILELEKSLRQLSRALKVTNADLEGQLALYEQIANDATLSFEAQKKGAEEALKVREQLFLQNRREALEAERIFKGKVAQMRANNELDEDLLDQQAEAVAARIAIENEYDQFLAESAELRRQIAQDVWEQDLDFAIDVGTRRTEEALKAAENEKLSFEERKKSLEEARKLDEEAFNNQLNLFEKVGLSRDKINQLVNESNAKVIADELKKTELSEIERNRFRELVLERQSLNEAIKDSETSLTEAIAESDKKQLESKKVLNDKLRELEDFRRNQQYENQIAGLTDIQEIFNLRMEQEQANFDAELEAIAERERILAETEGLTAEERAIQKAEIDLAKEEAEAEHAANVVGIKKEQADKEKEIEKQKQAAIKEVVASGQRAITDVYATQNNKVINAYNKRFASIAQQHAEGQMSDEEFAKASEDLEKEKALKIYEIQKKKFKTEKAVNLVTAISETAKGVARALGEYPFPFNLVAAGAVGAAGAIEIGAITSQKPPPPPTFEQGGDVKAFLAGGKDHSAGGTKYYGEDGNAFEVQKNEGIFVTKREATNPVLQLLDRENIGAGGRSMFSASSSYLTQGGRANQSTPGMTSEDVKEIVSNMPKQYVTIESIRGGIEAERESEEIGIV